MWPPIRGEGLRPDRFSRVGQFLFAGCAIGSLYPLVALGFVKLFRAPNIVSIAQGEFSMVGAYALFTLWHGLSLMNYSAPSC